MSAPTPPTQASPPPDLAPKPLTKPAFLLRILDGIAAHFAAHRQRSTWSFFWRITVEGMVVAAAVAIAADTLFRIEEDHELDDLTTKELILWACLAAPLYETLLQILPGELMRKLSQRFWIRVFVVTVPFATVHFTNDFWSGICAGVFGGFYLAFIYVHCRGKSLALAVVMTAASHAAGNSVAIALLLLGKHLETLKAVPL